MGFMPTDVQKLLSALQGAVLSDCLVGEGENTEMCLVPQLEVFPSTKRKSGQGLTKEWCMMTRQNFSLQDLVVYGYRRSETPWKS